MIYPHPQAGAQGDSLKILDIFRRESPATLAREALWRTRKRWRRMHLQAKLQDLECPVIFRAVGYYTPDFNQLGTALRAVTVSYADSVCRGEFPWFAYGPVKLGIPPAWDLDFVSSKTWLSSPSETIAVVRNDGSDVKVPWELSRLQFLPVLGKAWRLTGKAQYRNAAKHLLIDWIQKNPVGKGVNWTIAMEASLRAISICFCLDLLTPDGNEDAPWIRDVTKCLWNHLLFIEAHSEFSHFTRSNHYLSNIVGLFCLSSFLQGERMEERRQLYAKLVQQEILQQVYDDGGDYEASTGYHVLVLQMFTTAYLLMRSQGSQAPQYFVDRLESMYEFLSALSDSGGVVPQLGDCDDGRVELLTDDLKQMQTDERHRRSLAVPGLLGIGESLFQKPFGGRTEEFGWYESVPHSGNTGFTNTIHPQVTLFPNSGFAVAKNANARVIFTAIPNGIGGKGSHTHNDKLGVIATVNGYELLVDSGTGCYTRDPELRNRLRSTAAHNTLMIDEAEQNRYSISSDGLFRMGNDARVSRIALISSDHELTLQASHDGYGRLGVTHSRTVKLLAHGLLLEDDLNTVGAHRFQSAFHLPSTWSVITNQVDGSQVSCVIEGSVKVRMTCQAPISLRLRTSSEKISGAYGAVEDGLAIRVSGAFERSLKLVTEFVWEGN